MGDEGRPQSAAGVQLADGVSATTHLHRALRAAVDRHPEVFARAGVPDDPATFKASFADVLPRFEAARADSPRRTDIANAVVGCARDAMVVEPGAIPLADAVASTAEPAPLEWIRPGGSSRLTPRVPFGERSLAGGELAAAVHELVERGSASAPVATAVDWLLDHAGADGIDLTGRRIVMFGAGAELAPTRLWLAGGADVLWIDLVDPPAELRSADDLAGALHWVPGGIDLLTEPERVRATVEHFADGDPVDVGLYAYAPGRAREWRLTATMNAIVDGMPSGTVRSVAMLLSPTTCGVLTADDLALEARRRAERPRWQGVLDGVRALGRGVGHATCATTAANRGIVTIQGGSYQAAQYVGKLLTAEAWATSADPIAVSANTAGISLTESLHHPVFDIAFAGAPALGVETFHPATTAALNGLLTLHDRLDPAAATRSVEDLFTTRVHGGIYVLPYAIDPALRVATAIGVASDPRRVRQLFGR